MKICRYTKEQFIEAVKNSFSIRNVLKLIGVRPTGGNYAVAKRKIKLLNLNISHFTGRGHLKGKTHNWGKKIPLEKILIENSLYGGGTSKLKGRLIKEKLLIYKCYECGINEWKGKPLALDLEHKNGNRFDNRIENLTILCPNCHSQTSTYRGRKNLKNSY